MTAAVLVAMVAGAEGLGWRLSGRTRLFAVLAWLVIALAAAGVAGAVGGWGAVGLGLGAGAWLVLRWRWGADAAIGSLVVIAGLLLLADPEPSRAAAILAGLGAAVLLTHTANDVCRDVIARARVLPGDDAPAEHAEEAPRLRGGRFIGPLERWLIVGLALVGAQAVIVGLMAAKGIGRFPEISGDRGRGSAAEEFLVGSLVSWTLAGAAALLIGVLMP